MHEELLVLKGPQQLVRQSYAKAVLASIRIMAFVVHGKLIREICRACQHIGSLA